MADAKDPDDVILRAPNGRLLPGGGSPNPGGRPRLSGIVRDLAQKHSEEAMNELIDMMKLWRTATDEGGKQDSRVMAISQRAAETVIAYAIGRPAVTVDLTDKGESLLEKLANAITEKDKG